MKNKNFQLYLWSDIIAQIAGVAAALAVPIVIYRLTGDLALTGLLGTISGIAGLLGGIIGGSLADMYNRKPLIIATNIIAGALSLAMAWMIYTNTFHTAGFGLLLGTMMFSYIIGQSCADPSLPQLVNDEELAAAQGIIQARMQFAGLIGPLVGGVLLDIHMAVPFVAVSIGNFLTAIFYLFITARLNPEKRATTKILRTTSEGISIVARSPLLRNLIVMQTLANCAINGSLFIVVLALEAGNYPGWVIGIARTAIGIIGIFGALATGFFQKRFSYAVLQIGTSMWVATTIAIAALLNPTLWMVIPLGISVLTAPAAGAVTYAKIHQHVAEETFGRVTNLQVTIVTSISSMWSTPLGAIASRFSLAAGMWASALAGMLSVIPSLLLVRHIKRAESQPSTTA
ncbi:MAG: MFS transporter [Corynebacterium sp.]|uniref:MFS transporter n=1 Tax=Corynebacterium sp. TaxID=1720 RepID=UPI0026DC15EA|nr:MFS transporter [Corynebacterium sp.]MDO4761560.1 MFS transporter [Corynebacterium sp.]